MDFRDEIKEKLLPLTREQVCRFAWQCGVRVVPFLSTKRGFTHWREGDRQKHLYSIFHALDICGYGGEIGRAHV